MSWLIFAGLCAWELYLLAGALWKFQLAAEERAAHRWRAKAEQLI